MEENVNVCDLFIFIYLTFNYTDYLKKVVYIHIYIYKYEAAENL